jgi:hypothetical protein
MSESRQALRADSRYHGSTRRQGPRSDWRRCVDSSARCPPLPPGIFICLEISCPGTVSDRRDTVDTCLHTTTRSQKLLSCKPVASICLPSVLYVCIHQLCYVLCIACHKNASFEVGLVRNSQSALPAILLHCLRSSAATMQEN